MKSQECTEDRPWYKRKRRYKKTSVTSGQEKNKLAHVTRTVQRRTHASEKSLLTRLDKKKGGTVVHSLLIFQTKVSIDSSVRNGGANQHHPQVRRHRCLPGVPSLPRLRGRCCGPWAFPSRLLHPSCPTGVRGRQPCWRRVS